MPYKITFESLLLCMLMCLQFPLKGQTAGPSGSLDADSGFVQESAWHFPYESPEKAATGDPAASERMLVSKGAWKYSGEESDSTRFFAPAFSDSSWSAVNEASSGGGAVLLRKVINLSEEGAEKSLFISPPANVKATVWLNGKQVGRIAEGAEKMEFELSRFLRAGQNILALQLDLQEGTPLAALLGEVHVYTRPALHFKEVRITPTLDKTMRQGSLRLRMDVVNRMDSVRERLFGVLREQQYAAVSVRAKLIDNEGNTVIEFEELNNKQIRGGDQLAFEMEGSLNNVSPWSHETPYCYRLELTLLNAEGRVMEAVSRQVGFRLAEWKSGQLHVNGTPVPLRIFTPADSLSGGYRTQAQLLQDIGQIKKGNFNAVYAENYAFSPDWYSLANTHGVYVLEAGSPDPAGPADQAVPKSDPAHLTVPSAAVPAAAPAVVGLQLRNFLKGTITVANNFAFRDLSAYYLQWEVLRNGEKAEEGRVPALNLKPGAETTLRLGYKTRFYEGNDYFLNLRLKTKAADSLVPADFTVSSRQFRLGPYRYVRDYEIDKGLLEVSNGPASIVLNGYDFRIVFDKRSGQINRYSYKGRELLEAGPALSFRELPVTADSLEKSYAVWRAAAREASVIDYQITEDVNGNYYLSFTSSLLGGDARLFRKYRVDGRGAILVENVFVKMQGTQPAMPGFGTGFRLPAIYSQMEWYGREPAARNEVGIYKGAVDDYITGDKRDVRWLRISRPDGYGLMVRQENGSLFHFSAARQATSSSPLLLTIDLARTPLPFESVNFTYRLIPYISSTASE